MELVDAEQSQKRPFSEQIGIPLFTRVNALRISRAALIDRDDNPVEFACQNAPDLVAATAASGCMRMLGGGIDQPIRLA